MMTNRRRSQKQEKSVAKQFDGSLTAGSGAMWFSKGDVRTDKYLIECKTTAKEYYSLTAKVWEKISEEADRDGMRIPLMLIDVEDSKRVVVFNPKDFGIHQTSAGFPNKKSARIYASVLGAKADGTYNYYYKVVICGKKKSLLNCMLLEDFLDFVKENS